VKGVGGVRMGTGSRRGDLRCEMDPSASLEIIWLGMRGGESGDILFPHWYSVSDERFSF